MLELTLGVLVLGNLADWEEKPDPKLLMDAAESIKLLLNLIPASQKYIV